MDAAETYFAKKEQLDGATAAERMDILKESFKTVGESLTLQYACVKCEKGLPDDNMFACERCGLLAVCISCVTDADAHQNACNAVTAYREAKRAAAEVHTSAKERSLFDAALGLLETASRSQNWKELQSFSLIDYAAIFKRQPFTSALAARFLVLAEKGTALGGGVTGKNFICHYVRELIKGGLEVSVEMEKAMYLLSCILYRGTSYELANFFMQLAEMLVEELNINDPVVGRALSVIKKTLWLRSRGVKPAALLAAGDSEELARQRLTAAMRTHVQPITPVTSQRDGFSKEAAVAEEEAAAVPVVVKKCGKCQACRKHKKCKLQKKAEAKQKKITRRALADHERSPISHDVDLASRTLRKELGKMTGSRRGVGYPAWDYYDTCLSTEYRKRLLADFNSAQR